MAPIISLLVSEGLSLLAKVIQKKGKEYVEKKFKVKIPENIEKIDNETRKVKKEIVEDVLNQLLTDENINISQTELVNIVTRKVA